MVTLTAGEGAVILLLFFASHILENSDELSLKLSCAYCLWYLPSHLYFGKSTSRILVFSWMSVFLIQLLLLLKNSYTLSSV